MPPPLLSSGVRRAFTLLRTPMRTDQAAYDSARRRPGTSPTPPNASVSARSRTRSRAPNSTTFFSRSTTSQQGTRSGGLDDTHSSR